MNTYQGIYETHENSYIAYIDSANERKATRFFENWQKKLNRGDFKFVLTKVDFLKQSRSIKK